MPEGGHTRGSPRIAARGIRDIAGEIDSPLDDATLHPRFPSESSNPMSPSSSPSGNPAGGAMSWPHGALATQSMFPSVEVQASLKNVAAIVNWVGLSEATWPFVERRCSVEPIVRPRDLACLAPRVMLAAIMNAEVPLDGSDQTRPLTSVEGAKAGLVWRVARRMMGFMQDIDPIDVLAGATGNVGDGTEAFYKNCSFASSDMSGSERDVDGSVFNQVGTNSSLSCSPPTPQIAPKVCGVLSGIAEAVGCASIHYGEPSRTEEKGPRAEKKHSKKHRHKHHKLVNSGKDLTKAALQAEAKRGRGCLKHFFRRGNRTSITSTCFFVVYLLMSLFFIDQDNGWGVGSCFYFAVVTLTTVGYGDIYPTDDVSKIFTIFYVHFALVIVAMFVSNVQDIVLSALLAQQRQAMANTGIFKDEERKHLRAVRFFLMLCIYVVLLMAGTLFFAVSKDGTNGGWDVQGYETYDKSPAINGLYLTVITLTTVGYGDYVPDTPGQKAFGIFFMIIGIPLFTTVLASFTELCFGEQSTRVSLNIVKSMSEDNFSEIQHFTKLLAKQHVGNDCRDGQISRLEFLSFLLVRNGIVEVEDVGNVMMNFRRFDKGNTGFIGLDDVAHFCEHGSKKDLEEDSDVDAQPSVFTQSRGV